MKNMQFLDWGITGIQQNMNWVSNLLVYYLFFFTDSKVGDLSSLYMLAVSLILRLSSIAGKYSTFTPEQMNQVKRKNLKLRDIRKELMLLDWAHQKPEIVREELESSLNRLEIDRSITYVLFFKDKGHIKLQEGVKKIYKEHQNIFESIDSKATYSTKFGDKPVTFYNGSILMEYLINRFNEQHNYSCYRTPFFMVIALLYGLSDGFVRLYYG